MLILILIDVLYSQKAVFIFEKGSDCQNYSSSGYNQPAKNPACKISDFPTLNAIWKTLDLLVSILDLTSRGPRLLPGRREYEFSFEFMNLLLKIKGGDRRPNFIIFVV